jgi:tRNA(Ile)-lysidine synthase
LISGFYHRVLSLPGDLQNILKQGNLETVLREARLRILLERADMDNVDTILTGHHQDDQYETALIRLARGSTIVGLGGISISNDRFLRPQLDYSKVFLYPFVKNHFFNC